MKMFLNNKKNLIIVTVLIILLLLLVVLNNTEILRKIVKNTYKLSATKSVVEYEIMAKDSTNNELEIMINIENESGLDTIQVADFIINCNGKKKMSIDRKLLENSNTKIIVKGLNEEEEELVLIPTTEASVLMRLTEMLIDGEEKNKVELTAVDQDSQTYYSIDNGESWNLLLDEVIMYDIDVEQLVVNKMTNNIWEAKKKDEKKLVGYDTVTEVVEQIITKTGYYKVMVQNENISMHAFVEDEDLVIEETTQYGDSGDVATASTYAKNMVVLKVNGNLTVNEGATLTAYGTSYGGPKGMYIYSTGILQNNGEISMTARGAKAVGQNVYLFANLDGTYEYVPATGANGGATVNGHDEQPGKAGANGTNRKTGGGGSGGSGYEATSGKGAAGTSYSGGSGGGGSYRTSAGAAVANGGAGGYGNAYPTGTSDEYRVRRRSR